MSIGRGRVVTAPTQRLCIAFAVSGPARYAAGLDMARAWVRAFRRLGLPLSYTHGYSPHPRLSAAAPLPVGFAAEHELLDVYLDSPVDPHELAARLRGELPAGLALRSVRAIPLDEPPLPSRVRAADYVVTFLETPPQDLKARLQQLLGAESLPFTRVRQAKAVRFDLRPRILLAEVEELARQPRLLLRLVHGPGGAARPEDVLAALGLAPETTRITRVGLLLQPPL